MEEHGQQSWTGSSTRSHITKATHLIHLKLAYSRLNRLKLPEKQNYLRCARLKLQKCFKDKKSFVKEKFKQKNADNVESNPDTKQTVLSWIRSQC